MTQWNPSQQQLLDMWQKHMYSEFVLKDVDMALSTMTDDPYVLCVPVGNGGYGQAGVRRFYGEQFFTGMPADIQSTQVALTIAENTLIEESVISFTHDIPMAWMLPGVGPTGRRVELAFIGVISFHDGKICSERLYWDQASVLVQLGVIDRGTPAVCGVEPARLLQDPSKLAGRTLA
ncbi:MAG: nuclear transport factor 2 family protein [Nannocystis sp.]|uniref:ester cyclase n=1 Tax=Nannocystis sp. TaxID=1962667 RepID=UPI002426F6B3|nr:nuclear transport factor 2 family protein [Nannocystis sp.]MBK9756703.1 nuclear transport factor 2 family protein [Nannocystis sp.]